MCVGVRWVGGTGEHDCKSECESVCECEIQFMLLFDGFPEQRDVMAG